jgi:hypothetical protein
VNFYTATHFNLHLTNTKLKASHFATLYINYLSHTSHIHFCSQQYTVKHCNFSSFLKVRNLFSNHYTTEGKAVLLLLLLVVVVVVVFSPWAGLAGTRAQSGDWYSSGMLHSGQALRGSLPLLSPAFRHSHFRCQMPPRPQQCGCS